MSACHFIWAVKIHHFISANDSAYRKRAADAFTEAEQIRHNLIMLESPLFAASAETCLYLIESKYRLMLIAPFAKLLRVFGGHKTRSASLVCLSYYACDIVGIDAKFRKTFFKQFKACVLAPETVRVGDMHYFRVEIFNPRLSCCASTELLSTIVLP